MQLDQHIVEKAKVWGDRTCWWPATWCSCSGLFWILSVAEPGLSPALALHLAVTPSLSGPREWPELHWAAEQVHPLGRRRGDCLLHHWLQELRAHQPASPARAAAAPGHPAARGGRGQQGRPATHQAGGPSAWTAAGQHAGLLLLWGVRQREWQWRLQRFPRAVQRSESQTAAQWHAREATDLPHPSAQVPQHAGPEEEVQASPLGQSQDCHLRLKQGYSRGFGLPGKGSGVMQEYWTLAVTCGSRKGWSREARRACWTASGEEVASWAGEQNWCGVNQSPLMMPNSLHNFPSGVGRDWVMAWDFVNYLVNDSQL